MKTKKSVIITLTSIFITLPVLAFAHPGKTDSRGGHKDNKNASSLGAYHFHCDGYPAHLHEGGICPYTDNNTSVNDNSTESNIVVDENDKSDMQKRLDALLSKSEKTEVTEETQQTQNVSKVEAERIEITVQDIIHVRYVPLMRKICSAKIYPENTTDKTIKWSVSDEDIAQIDQKGNLVLKKDGKVTITAEASNGVKGETELKVELKTKENIIVSSIILISLIIICIIFVLIEKKKNKEK